VELMMSLGGDSGLPVVRACDLAQGKDDPTWLFEGLWADSGVGVIGGEPKACKSWLALEMATSLAAGRPCLDLFETPTPGRVLVYMAEDAAVVVKQRLEGICRHRQLDLEDLPLYVITASSLRLDHNVDQLRLHHTVERLRPKMLLLDPLVRLHQANENSAAEVSALLAYFRNLQRSFDMAVILVHHSRKNGSTVRLGQALRGSGDLHAFGDSNLYLRRVNDRLILAFEHRAAPAPDPIEIRLATGDDPHLEVVGQANRGHSNDRLDQQVVQLLDREAEPISRKDLRARLGVRNARLGGVLNRLQANGRVRRTPQGYGLAQ
jgi:hypothetical protein